MRLPSLSSKIYTKGYKFPKTSWFVTPLSMISSHAAKALVYSTPTWTKADHLAAAKRSAKLSKALHKAWGRAQDKAHLAVFGKKAGFSDYRVSGIGRSEYRESDKNILRRLATDASSRSILAHAHERAAALVNRMKRR